MVSPCLLALIIIFEFGFGDLDGLDFFSSPMQVHIPSGKFLHRLEVSLSVLLLNSQQPTNNIKPSVKLSQPQVLCFHLCLLSLCQYFNFVINPLRRYLPRFRIHEHSIGYVQNALFSSFAYCFKYYLR